MNTLAGRGSKQSSTDTTHIFLHATSVQGLVESIRHLVVILSPVYLNKVPKGDLRPRLIH